MFINVKVNASGVKQALERLLLIRAELFPAVERAAISAVQETVDDLKAFTPVGERGISPPGDAQGHLADSFYMTSGGGDNGFRLTVQTTQPRKLDYVRHGTGVYGPVGVRITPVRAKALYWEGAAHTVPSVAGQHANDFVTPVLEEAVPRIMSRVEQAALAVIEGA